MFPGETLGIPDSMSGSTTGTVPRPGGTYGPNTGAMEHLRMLAYLNRTDHMGSMGHLGGFGHAVASHMGFGAQDLSGGPLALGTMDMDAMNQLLAPYGQHMPTEVPQNAFLPSTGFFGRHGRLSAGIEGALLGAANTGPSNTIGEGISNAIRGGLSGTAERRQLLNMPYLQPFQTASMVQQLQQGGAQLDELRARTGLATQQANYYSNRDDLASNKLAATRPVPVEGGTYVFNSDSNKWDFNEGEGGKAAKAYGGIAPALHQYFGVMGLDPSKTPSQADFKKAHDMWFRENTGLRSAGAGVSAGAADNRQDASFAHSDARAEFDAEKVTNSTKPSQLFRIFGTMSPSQQQVDEYNSKLLQSKMDSNNARPRRGSPAQGGAAPRGASVDDVLNMFINSQSGAKGGPQPNHFLDPNTPQGGSPSFQIPGVMPYPGTQTPYGSPLPGTNPSFQHIFGKK